ncbi:MAG: TM1812 family CRISPR-associated protein [Faecalibacterium sp.]
MGKNVLLLYLSLYNPKPASNGKSYERAQTNEAAVREMKRLREGPDRILALCSESVRQKKTVPGLAGAPDRTTLEYFRAFLSENGLKPEVLEIVEVPDSMNDRAQTAAIATLLDRIAPEDILSIDLSGGLRDTAMLLVTIARCMRDLRGVNTRRVVYSELKGQTSALHDSTQLYTLFDLITAMDEFFSTGRAQKLKTHLYSEVGRNSSLHDLLTKINAFSDDLALCQVDHLKNDLKAISKCLNTPLDESATLTELIFRLLKERFKAEFQDLLENRQENLPALVNWCANHGLYQQALTLLCEEMPEYVCKHLFVQPTKKGWDYLVEQEQNKGKAWTWPLFHFHFTRLTPFKNVRPEISLALTKTKNDAEGNMLFRIATENEMHNYLQQVQDAGQLILDPRQEQRIERAGLLYQKIMQYRNQINHASGNAAHFPPDSLQPMDASSIEAVLFDTAAFLREIRTLKPAVPQGTEALPITCCIPVK